MFKHASSIPETSESETASSPSLSVSDSMRRRATIASVLGNALEWFDFVVYGLLSAMIARLFFPSDNPTNSVLLGFATLGISFVARPIDGMAPFILAWFGSVAQNAYGPVYYIAAVALLGLIGLRLVSLSRERHASQCAAPGEAAVASPAQGQQV